MLEAPVPPKFENGAKIVALAWTDPVFKSNLLKDAKEALRESGIAVYRSPKVVALENTEKVHNVIVCTLCSCYPYAILGNPPWWYKDDSYKQAIVGESEKDAQGNVRFCRSRKCAGESVRQHFGRKVFRATHDASGELFKGRGVEARHTRELDRRRGAAF